MKQRKLISRIISLALAVCMLVAVAPSMPSAQAADDIVISLANTAGAPRYSGAATVAANGWAISFEGSDADFYNVRQHESWSYWTEGGVTVYLGRHEGTDKVGFDVQVDKAGYYTLKVNAAAGSATALKFDATVNGDPAGSFSWDASASGEMAADVPVFFREGINVISFQYTGTYVNQAARTFSSITLSPANVERQAVKFSFAAPAAVDRWNDLDLARDGHRVAVNAFEGARYQYTVDYSSYGADATNGVVSTATGRGGHWLDIGTGWSNFMTGPNAPDRHDTSNLCFYYNNQKGGVAFQFDVKKAGQYDIVVGAQAITGNAIGADVYLAQGNDVAWFNSILNQPDAHGFTKIGDFTFWNKDASLGADLFMNHYVGSYNFAQGPVSMKWIANAHSTGVPIFETRDAYRLVESTPVYEVNGLDMADEGYYELAQNGTLSIPVEAPGAGSYYLYIDAYAYEGAFFGKYNGSVWDATTGYINMDPTSIGTLEENEVNRFVAGPFVLTGNGTITLTELTSDGGTLEIDKISLHRVAQQMWMSKPSMKTDLNFGTINNGYGWKFRPDLSGDYGNDFAFGNFALDNEQALGGYSKPLGDHSVRYYFDSGVDANGINFNRQKGNGHLTFDVEIPESGLYDVSATLKHAPASSTVCGVWASFYKIEGDEKVVVANTKGATGLADEMVMKSASMGTINLPAGTYQMELYGYTQDENGEAVNEAARKYITLKDITLTPKAAEFASLSASIDNAKLMAGAEAQITVSGKMTDGADADVSGVAYSVEGDSVEVSADGKVTAVKAGTAIVTASATIGDITKTASVSVKVMDNVLGATYAYVREDKTAEAVSYKLALFGGVNDNENIAEVGFEVTVNGDTAAAGNANVYSKIVLTYKNGTAELLPAQLGAQYIFFNEQSYDASFADAEVTFRAYVVDGAGDTYYGDYATISTVAAN